MTNTVIAKSTEIVFMFFAALFWFQVEAVRQIAQGKAPRITQPQEGATYECIQKKDNAKVINKDRRSLFHYFTFQLHIPTSMYFKFAESV